MTGYILGLVIMVIVRLSSPQLTIMFRNIKINNASIRDSHWMIPQFIEIVKRVSKTIFFC